MKKALITSVAALGLFMLSCKHEVVTPTSPVVSFATDVNPIIIGNCTQARCHGDVDPAEFPLLTYDDVIQHGHVKPGNADNSRLFNSIAKLNGENVMPQEPYKRLSDKQIQIIYLWIMQGAQNN